MVCRSVPTPLDVLVLLLLWGWSEIRLAPVRLLCISIAQKYKTARTRRTFGAKYWSSKMQILDLGIWDIVSLNHGWIKVCIKCFSRLCSIVIPKYLSKKCCMQALNEVYYLQYYHLMQRTIKMQCCKYLLWCQLYPADWLVAWLASEGSTPAEISLQRQCSAMQYNNFLLDHCSNPTAWISAEKALTLGILWRHSQTRSISARLISPFGPSTKFVMWKYFANFCGKVEKRILCQLFWRDFSGWLVLPPRARNR